jgi:glycosyltransferase involved in cell wall biosynthesis
VIYIGYSTAYRVLDDPAGLEAIRLKYGLNTPFLYYRRPPGLHRNHRRLLEALRIMKERYRFDGQLVLSGVSMQAHDTILEEITRFGLQDMVRVLGYLPYADLPWLYNLARVMVFPSLFEGFGIPLAEAMACGCPVACSNVASIPEVVGEAGALFDQESAEDIAEKTWLLWTDDAVRKRLIGAGLDRVKMFTKRLRERRSTSTRKRRLVDMFGIVPG